MRASHSFRVTWRHLNFHLNLNPKRRITTRPATVAEITHELLNRPPRVYHDLFDPCPSRLLSLSLPGLGLTKKHFYAHLLTPGNHAVLPQGHHLVFFRPTHPTDSLLADGTDQDHLPDALFTRRLWASGSVAYSQGWKSKSRLLHNRWVCHERITGVALKGVPHSPGTSFDCAPGPGHKLLVDVERRYLSKPRPKQPYDEIIVERRTLCFMTPKTAEDIRSALEQPIRKSIKAPTLPQENSAGAYFQSFTLTPAALFRFSALTFNAHRIHLDPQHCREVEGYPDLLVHGPLLLVLMFSVLNSRGHIVDRLDYQNLAPVYVGEEIKVCVQRRKEDWSVWIAGPQGDLRVKATAILDPRPEDGGMFRLTTPKEECDESRKESVAHLDMSPNKAPSSTEQVIAR